MVYLRMTLITLGVFNVADYFLTLRCLESGFVEGNPIIAPVVGTAWFPVIKIVLVPLGLYLIWRVRNQIGVMARSLVFVVTGIYAGLMWYFMMLISSGMVS